MVGKGGRLMNKTQKLVTYSLLMALVCLGTMFIKIHVPATNGYVNIGDAFIIISSLMFGPVAGMIAGGIGSAMADLLSGYAHFSVFTLVVKGIEGYIIGWLFLKFGKSKLVGMYSSLAGVTFMVFGYFVVETVMYSSYQVALQSVVFNGVQALASFIIGYPVFAYISKNVKLKFNTQS